MKKKPDCVICNTLSLPGRFSCAMEIRHTPSKRHRPTVLVAMHPETMTALARFRLGSHSEPLGATRSHWERRRAPGRRFARGGGFPRLILNLARSRQFNGPPMAPDLQPIAIRVAWTPAGPRSYARGPLARVSQRARAHPPGELAVAVMTAGQCPPKTGTQRPVGAQRTDLGADLSGPPPRRLLQRPPSRGHTPSAVSIPLLATRPPPPLS